MSDCIYLNYLYIQQRRSYIYANTQVLTHLDKKYGKIISQFRWILDFTCTKRMRRNNINLSKSNFDRVRDYIVRGTL